MLETVLVTLTDAASGVSASNRKRVWKKTWGGHANAHFREPHCVLASKESLGGVCAFNPRHSNSAMMCKDKGAPVSHPMISPNDPPRPKRVSRLDRTCGDGAAFSRVDLLALVSVAAVFLSSLLVGHSSTQSTSAMIVCLRNVRMLTEGWAGYVDDNQGDLPPAVDVDGRQSWAGDGWLDLPATARDNVDPYGGDRSISQGELWQYAGSNPSIWRCPSDPSTGRHPNYMDDRRVPRVRSYSMNNWMGTAWARNDFLVFTNLSDFALAAPNETFLFVGERHDSINDGSFAVDMTGFRPDDRTAGARNRASRIVSFPSNHHGNAGVIGFVDGRVESRAWVDARTTPQFTSGELTLNIPTPGNKDVYWLQLRATVQIR